MIVYQSLRVFLGLFVVAGIVYPLVVWLWAQLLFKDLAEGSLIEREGVAIGSRLIQQEFRDPKYFWSRPSYSYGRGMASHLAPTSSSLNRLVLERAKKYREWDELVEPADIPDSLLTASGSGWDPHLDLDAVEFQVDRIAKARKLLKSQETRLQELIVTHRQNRQWGLWGMERVSVLELNLSLDREFPSR